MRKQLRWFEADTGTNPSVPGGETPSGTTPSGETPTTPTGETPESTTAQTRSPADLQKEIDRLANSLKRANAEAKAEREAATELKKFKEQIENEKLSAQEKAEKQLARIQKEHEEYRLSIQERVVTSELRAVAADLGFADVTDAVRLLDRADLDFDEDGTPKNARELLEKLAKAKPYLLKSPGQQKVAAPTSGGATNPPRSQSSQPQVLSWGVIGKMNAEEYNARRPEIAAWIAEHPHRYGRPTR